VHPTTTLDKMFVPLYATYGPTFLISVIVLYLFQCRYRYGLNSFRGPTIASFTNGWRVWYTWYYKHKKPLVAIHEKYGEVVRVGPRVLSFSSPRAVRDIYGTQQNYKKVRNHSPSQSSFAEHRIVRVLCCLSIYR
jgi:hypothetical protein